MQILAASGYAPGAQYSGDGGDDPLFHRIIAHEAHRQPQSIAGRPDALDDLGVVGLRGHDADIRRCALRQRLLRSREVSAKDAARTEAQPDRGSGVRARFLLIYIGAAARQRLPGPRVPSDLHRKVSRSCPPFPRHAPARRDASFLPVRAHNGQTDPAIDPTPAHRFCFIHQALLGSRQTRADPSMGARKLDILHVNVYNEG